MNNTFKNILSYILGAILVFGAVAIAGTLTPGGNTSTPTMYTLSDIYSKIQNINFTPSAHTVSTSSSPVGTFNTLTQIYTALNDLDYTASDIATGTSIMGVTGNITIPAEADVRLSTTYGPNNTLTGEMSAGAAPLEWSADNPAGYVDWATAVAYCSGLGGGYRLPHMWELAQYYQQNGTGSFQSDYYWSSTEFPFDPGRAYGVGMDFGNVDHIAKMSPFLLARCVR